MTRSGKEGDQQQKVVERLKSQLSGLTLWLGSEAERFVTHVQYQLLSFQVTSFARCSIPRQSSLWLTFVDLWPFPVQPLRQGLIRVRLDAQRLADTQHLEQEGQVSLGGIGVFGDDGFGQVFLWIRGENFGERAGGRGLVRWEGYVGAHPELRAGNVSRKQVSSGPSRPSGYQRSRAGERWMLTSA